MDSQGSNSKYEYEAEDCGAYDANLLTKQQEEKEEIYFADETDFAVHRPNEGISASFEETPINPKTFNDLNISDLRGNDTDDDDDDEVLDDYIGVSEDTDLNDSRDSEFDDWKFQWIREWTKSRRTSSTQDRDAGDEEFSVEEKAKMGSTMFYNGFPLNYEDISEEWPLQMPAKRICLHPTPTSDKIDPTSSKDYTNDLLQTVAEKLKIIIEKTKASVKHRLSSSFDSESHLQLPSQDVRSGSDDPNNYAKTCDETSDLGENVFSIVEFTSECLGQSTKTGDLTIKWACVPEDSDISCDTQLVNQAHGPCISIKNDSCNLSDPIENTVYTQQIDSYLEKSQTSVQENILASGNI